MNDTPVSACNRSIDGAMQQWNAVVEGTTRASKEKFVLGQTLMLDAFTEYGYAQAELSSIATEVGQVAPLIKRPI